MNTSKKLKSFIVGLIWVSLFSLITVQSQTVVTEWDQFATSGATAAGPAMDSLIAQCETENTGVKILRTVVPSIGIRETYRLAASANKVPDLTYTWPAASVLAGYAKNNVIAPLDAYKEKFGWELNDFYAGRNSYEGKLYGLPLEQDLMGVYYNKAMFEELGLSAPTTYEEFLAAADAIKAAGYIPIAFGNRDRWPATNTLSLILGLTSGREKEEEVFFGDEKWTRPEFVTAAQTFVDWVDKGYFPDGFNGIGYDEANALFNLGQAAMTMTGTWVIQDIARDASFDVGVFMLPPIVEGIAPGTMWGEGSQWHIAASSAPEAQDAAATFLNCIMAPDKRQTWVEKGFLVPIGTTAEELAGWEAPQLVKDFYSEGLKTPDTNFYDLHTTVPESVTQTLYAELQSLLSKENTPEQFLEKMQAAWDTAVTNGERWVP
jgi:raffinose/stachyose/melibiose transport system substrate-binding protein